MEAFYNCGEASSSDIDGNITTTFYAHLKNLVEDAYVEIFFDLNDSVFNNNSTANKRSRNLIFLSDKKECFIKNFLFCKFVERILDRIQTTSTTKIQKNNAHPTNTTELNEESDAQISRILRIVRQKRINFLKVISKEMKSSNKRMLKKALFDVKIGDGSRAIRILSTSFLPANNGTKSNGCIGRLLKHFEATDEESTSQPSINSQSDEKISAETSAHENQPIPIHDIKNDAEDALKDENIMRLALSEPNNGALPHLKGENKNFGEIAINNSNFI